jgi:hypothetical protein
MCADNARCGDFGDLKAGNCLGLPATLYYTTLLTLVTLLTWLTLWRDGCHVFATGFRCQGMASHSHLHLLANLDITRIPLLGVKCCEDPCG